jgi:hypothetical protein
VGEAFGEAKGVTLALGEGDETGEFEGVAVPDGDGDALGVGVGVGLPVGPIKIGVTVSCLIALAAIGSFALLTSTKVR